MTNAGKGGGLHVAGQPQVRDSETIPPEELLQYVVDRLNAEVAVNEEESKRRGVRGLPGDRERNIAITHLQTGALWLRESRGRAAGQ